MRHAGHGESGFSLIETMIALSVLTVGALGMAQVFLHGMHAATSSPNELLATQKASEAVESVFSARDSHRLTWAQLRNTSDGGIFLAGARQMKTAGGDGVLNTSDDGAIETVQFPGPDQMLGTSDDRTLTLTEFTREIRIVDVTPDLRSIAITITYNAGPVKQTYTLTSYISAFA
jgi:prepilin-type N-terminal cleavage/methylation domain-containing protein